MSDKFSIKKSFQLHPIGQIKREDNNIYLEILDKYKSALKQIEHFSHIIVLWWIEGHDNEDSRSILTTKPPYADNKVTGVFACRSEYRPNPIGLTVCEILKVDEDKGLIKIKNIDAYDGSFIVDIKAYFPVVDRVKHAKIPEWLSDWPEWLPDEGIGLYEE